MPKRLPIGIPQTAEELTAEWLTWALRESTGAGDARVVAFTTAAPGAGVGFSGLSIRIDLTWEPANPELPAAVLAMLARSLLGEPAAISVFFVP